MLLNLPAESKIFYCVYYSLLELLGGEQADEVFSSAGLDPFDLKAPNYFKHGSVLLEKVAAELCAHYGEETTRGLLIRMGNASLTFFRKYFSNVAQLGSIENRLKPLDRRFLLSLKTLAEVLSDEMEASLNVGAESARSYVWQINKADGNLSAIALMPFFYFGLLEEFCNWLDTRKNYLLNYEAGENRKDMEVISIEIRDLD
ncbi:MAG: hypothetical protein Q8N39_08625 [Pelolinea sp.]|nr:hypothetical protein [Pelolinea sp.]